MVKLLPHASQVIAKAIAATDQWGVKALTAASRL
jgi:hypothetical protein